MAKWTSTWWKRWLGQQCISLRWVVREKVANEKKIIKAPLCARGFGKEQNFMTDSPPAPEKDFDYRVASYHLTSGH